MDAGLALAVLGPSPVSGLCISACCASAVTASEALVIAVASCSRFHRGRWRQILLYAGSVINIDKITGELLTEARDHSQTEIGGMQLALFFDNVITLQQGRHDGSIGTGDRLELFQFLDQAGLGAARWSLGRLLDSLQFIDPDGITDVQIRQLGLIIGSSLIFPFGLSPTCALLFVCRSSV